MGHIVSFNNNHIRLVHDFVITLIVFAGNLEIPLFKAKKKPWNSKAYGKYFIISAITPSIFFFISDSQNRSTNHPACVNWSFTSLSRSTLRASFFCQKSLFVVTCSPGACSWPRAYQKSPSTKIAIFISLHAGDSAWQKNSVPAVLPPRAAKLMRWENSWKELQAMPLRNSQ